MKLEQLIELIDDECAMHDRIDAEIRKWVTPNEHGDTSLKLAIRAFGGGSLRKSAKALGVSATYMSHCCNGKLIPSRSLMTRLHNTYGTGSKGIKR